MTKIKTDKNASEALARDPTDRILHVTFTTCDVVKSQQSISDPTPMT